MHKRQRGSYLERRRRWAARKVRNFAYRALTWRIPAWAFGRRVRLARGSAAPSTASGGPVVACVVRDGVEYVDAFLDHYRRLGADAFVLLDNGSTDGTLRALLAAGSDVTVLTASLPFATFKHFFRHHLIRRFGWGRWCLSVDIDEHFVYPGCETRSLVDLGAYLDAHGYDALVAHMVDMFAGDEPAPTVAAAADFRRVHTHYDASDLVRCPYPYVATLPGIEIPFLEGGIRKTVFGTERLCLSKHPLVKVGPGSGIRLVPSSHGLEGARIADLTGALLHYKFVGDFAARARRAVAERNYQNESYEYRRYLEVIERDAGVSLCRPTARRFESATQLVEEGVLTESERARRWREADVGAPSVEALSGLVAPTDPQAEARHGAE